MGYMKDLYDSIEEVKAISTDSNIVVVLPDRTIDGNLTLTNRPANILMLKPVLSEDIYDYCREVAAMGHNAYIRVHDGVDEHTFNIRSCHPDDVKDVWSALSIMSEL